MATTRRELWRRHDGRTFRHVRYTDSVGNCYAIGYQPGTTRHAQGSFHPAGNMDPARVVPITMTRAELALSMLRWRTGKVRRVRVQS